MRVLVTGGIGRVGKAVVDRLLQNGFSLLVVDRQEDVSIPGADYSVCDVLNYPCVRELMRGCDAVVHLAAIPSPGIAPNEMLFNINVTGTYNIFQAAAEEGIRRVVQASSINAVGYYYGVRNWRLSYLPIDEEHPTETSDPYSLSKWMVEEIGRYFWRRSGVSSVALRFPAVVSYTAMESSWLPRRQEALRIIVDRLLKMPVAERLAWFEENQQGYDDLRARHVFEDPSIRDQMYRLDSPLSPDLRIAIGGRCNFFAMIDERDAAQSVEKGLTADYEGSHPLFVNDRVQWTGVDTSLVASLFYPDVGALRRPLHGKEALVSNARARQLIGFDPEYSLG
jgi:nucleoside-diphosphate-sugar epimerase